MAVKKLTLSAPEEVIADAKRIAERKRTSVSGLFVRLVRACDQEADPQDSLGPITLRASGVAALPADRADAELLEEALSEKYGSE